MQRGVEPSSCKARAEQTVGFLRGNGHPIPILKRLDVGLVDGAGALHRQWSNWCGLTHTSAGSQTDASSSMYSITKRRI